MKPAMAKNERERLRVLHDYRILDTPQEDRYSDIVRLAAEVCETPMAAISFVDRYRQWFKATVGLDLHETARDVSFCAHAILESNNPLIVEDAREDPRFADNPLVTGPPGLRFYAGIPLVARGGHAVGALCVLDYVPKALRTGQIEALCILGKNVVSVLDSHRAAVASGDAQDACGTIRSPESAAGRICGLLDGLELGVFAASGFLGRITEANKALVAMLEAPSPAALGQVHIRDLFADPAEYDQIAECMLHENRMVVQHVRLLTLRKRTMFCQLAITAERQNSRVSILGTIQNTTETRKIVRDRDLLFNLSLDMLCTAGHDGYFKDVNPAFERTLGYSREELLVRPFLDFVHPDDVAHTLSEAMKLADCNSMVTFENRYRCKSGEYKQLSWVATTLPDEALVHASARDVSSRVHSEEIERTLLGSYIEIALARDIQCRLLPKQAPQVEGFDIAGFVHQFEAVGGDYYDYIPGQDDTLFLVVGDVAGHGVAPAVLMAQVRTFLWSILPGCSRIGDAMQHLNTMLHATVPRNYFVTLQLVGLNTRTGEVCHASCGHPPGFLLGPSGEIVAQLDSSGVPLGCFADCGVQVEEGPLFPLGGTLVLVTDGMLEACSPTDEMFGEDRVLDVVRVNHHKSAAQIIESLQSALKAFCLGKAVEDDITALIVRRPSSGATLR